ncbi:hypothetical protein CCM_05609 [Cordyceps militaris CM01]|uniref:Uncharacterized protein n=1 Tax=Cordyceps militaris (strain CM01) TaxID=983644 RepID=G3JKL2_CORMM|nr:uncharacterized protein CCM_05609 [Cordyceps militaris CM01]EGX91451.1 hypothetical protein CCM_05609 [Cordyceps militaris CM01]
MLCVIPSRDDAAGRKLFTSLLTCYRKPNHLNAGARAVGQGLVADAQVQCQQKRRRRETRLQSASRQLVALPRDRDTKQCCEPTSSTQRPKIATDSPPDGCMWLSCDACPAFALSQIPVSGIAANPEVIVDCANRIARLHSSTVVAHRAEPWSEGGGYAILPPVCRSSSATGQESFAGRERIANRFLITCLSPSRRPTAGGGLYQNWDVL